MDRVRREAWAGAHRQAKSQPKRKPGRPAKGETAPKRTQAKTVKNLRYALLKNPEHLSENQQAQLQFLTKANPTLYRASLLFLKTLNAVALDARIQRLDAGSFVVYNK